MTFDDIKPYLQHLQGCYAHDKLRSQTCTCGLEDIKNKLAWTHGARCPVEGCKKIQLDCGKCKDHCECKYPFDD